MRSPGHVALLLFLSSAAVATSQDSAPKPVPVVVAVDTSRSLNSEGLGAAVDRLRVALVGLAPETPAALLAFDDSPRWVVRPGASPDEVGRALSSLQLQGRYTLLNDALFVATRELDEGGVVLLLSDGKDENSATTVDDIARRCEALGIRILTLAMGGAIQERPLRRLALISDGTHLGAADSLDGSDIARALTTAQSEVETSRAQAGQRRVAEGEASPVRSSSAEPSAAREPAGPAPGPTPPPGSSPENTEASDGRIVRGVDNWLLGLLGGILLGASVFWFLRGRSRGPQPTFCSRCGTELEPGTKECEQCDALELEPQLAGREVASLQETPEVTVDTAVFHRNSLEESLEKTRVMTDQGVLVARRTGESPRLYLLSNDKAFGVGRQAEGNTLAIPDPALSAHHFKVVPQNGAFFFVDLGSTNGSFVNGHRSTAKRLHTGDVIRAGQVEFEYQNPTEV